MKLRIVQFDCPESKPGVCYMVERKGWFGWTAHLVDFNYAGSAGPQHFSTPSAAVIAIREDAKRRSKLELKVVWEGDV